MAYNGTDSPFIKDEAESKICTHLYILTYTSEVRQFPKNHNENSPRTLPAILEKTGKKPSKSKVTYSYLSNISFL